MIEFEIGQQLPICEIVANNYAKDAANKIHSDDGAAEYDFEAGLVPGVAIFAYLTRPVVGALGADWIERGTISARFLKPVYDREKVRVQATVSSASPIAFNLELFNPDETLCAVGTASLPATLAALDHRNYPRHALDRIRPASIAAIPVGEAFGAVEFNLDLNGDVRELVVDVVDASSLYRGENALCHPAWWIAQANEAFIQNIDLGMWVHTASEMRQYATARDGEPISVRSRVAAALEKREHEFLTLDVGVFGENDRPIAQIDHTAIIKLRSS